MRKERSRCLEIVVVDKDGRPVAPPRRFTKQNGAKAARRAASPFSPGQDSPINSPGNGGGRAAEGGSSPAAPSGDERDPAAAKRAELRARAR